MGLVEFCADNLLKYGNFLSADYADYFFRLNVYPQITQISADFFFKLKITNQSFVFKKFDLLMIFLICVNLRNLRILFYL